MSKTVSNFPANVLLVAAMGLAACAPKPEQPAIQKVDKVFASAGSVEMQLDGGDYTIRASKDEHIRVSFGPDSGDASAELTTSGTHASLTVKNTPHSNFKATLEIPATTDLVVHLSAGNLEVGAIAGNKDIDSKAGNVELSIARADDYSSVDASVKVGNLEGGPFGDSGSGLSPHLKWSGPGKHSLRASLMAGNLEFKR